jgi:hypothetical protein
MISHVSALNFTLSRDHRERRYRAGRIPGTGSYGGLVCFRAEVMNAFVTERGIESVVGCGCGDDAQLSLANYPRYLGRDISPTVIERRRKRLQSRREKAFALAGTTDHGVHDLAASSDIILYLVKHETFHQDLETLFGSSRRSAFSYSRSSEMPEPEPHIGHRAFSRWAKPKRPQRRPLSTIKNRYPYAPSDPDQTFLSDFYTYGLSCENGLPGGGELAAA